MPNLCPCSLGNSISSALNNLRNAKKLSTCAPEQAADAVVTGKEVRHINTIYHENPYQYIVRFRLENGEELELKTSEEQFAKLAEGQNSALIWSSDTLIRFG